MRAVLGEDEWQECGRDWPHDWRWRTKTTAQCVCGAQCWSERGRLHIYGGYFTGIPDLGLDHNDGITVGRTS